MFAAKSYSTELLSHHGLPNDLRRCFKWTELCSLFELLSSIHVVHHRTSLILSLFGVGLRDSTCTSSWMITTVLSPLFLLSALLPVLPPLVIIILLLDRELYPTNPSSLKLAVLDLLCFRMLDRMAVGLPLDSSKASRLMATEPYLVLTAAVKERKQ